MEVVEKQKKDNGRVLSSLKKVFSAVVSSRGRKVALLTGLLALLVVTGYLNFTLNQNASEVGAGAKTETDLFATFKDGRSDTRLARQLLLEDIIANTGASATAKANAESELIALAAEIAFENTAEGLIMAQCGFDDVVVSKNGAKLNVIVKTNDEITTEQITQIMKILATCYGKDRLEPENGDSLFISQM